MNIQSTIQTAYKAIKIHKGRSALTVLGLVIGVTSIILVMNLGQGIKGFVLGQLEVFGTDYLQVEIKVPSTSKTSSSNSIGIAQGISITTLKIEDAEAVLEHPNIRGYFAGVMGQEVASFEDENETATIWGVTSGFFDLYATPVEYGRGFTDEEDKSLSRVVVLGSGIRDDLFPNREAIGERISMDNKKFTVIGVMEEQGNALFMDMDSLIIMPARTLQKQILGIDHLQFFTAYLNDANQTDATAEDVTEILRDQHDITDPDKDDFSVTTSEEALAILGDVTGAINLLLVAIAAISLVVGGVGIMNIMYVSVSERTYEIGLRKAVGATRSNILWQFLMEAVFLTLSGGLLGVLFGTLLSVLGALGAQAAGFEWQYTFSLMGVVIAVGFSVVVGLLFGIYPARQAAAMTPVEALRFE